MAIPLRAPSPTDDLTAGLLEAFRRGEREPFFVVYETHASEVRGLAARFFRTTFEREEAVQEIWMNVHQAAAQYDPARGGLRTWIRAVATNRCLQILRARGRRPTATEEIADEDLVAPDSPQAAVVDGRVRAAVDAFAAGLDEEERAVFRLSFVEGLAQDEVARRLDISVRRTKYLKKKVLEKAALATELRSLLEEVGS